MRTANTKLTERVTALERSLRKVQVQLREVYQVPQQPWWERLAGRFKDEPLFDEIVEAGRLYRQSLTSYVR
jgi:hypothetical protein